jgi:hypothetical protein
MDEVTRRTFDLMLGSGLTHHRVDAKRAVIALRGANPEDRDEVKQMILAKRRSWLVWLTVTQRQWQRHIRHTRKRTLKAYAFRSGGIERAPARIQEEIATREGYVRCHA